jgi:tetratricopeptide (TPR) repeat protein
MKNKRDKVMADLHRALASQEFNSEAEVREFLEKYLGDEIPSMPARELSPQEKAQDLVAEAYELDYVEARMNVALALSLDPDCIEAYEILGSMENAAQIGVIFFEKGISIGRRIFGGKYLQENKGLFWDFHETRPFMRCLKNYADCLYAMGKVKECVAILEEMIQLNPNDNQGARDPLLLYLVQLGENKKFLKYAKMFDDDAMSFGLFTRALFAFKTEGETENVNKKLAEALAQNKFVAKLLLSTKAKFRVPDSYGFGDKSEAEYYAVFAYKIWAETPGAREWLKKHSVKSKGKK